jgi:hypothetical protein
MGLDLRVKNYRTDHTKIGSYIGFNDFRRAWAEHLGFNLSEMEGLGGSKKWTNEPLQSFFNHSDCDGEISPEDCKKILAQAEKDLPLLTDEQSQYSMPILIRFCKAAIKNNKPLEFV